MIWFLIIHIVSLLLWCAAFLYIPVFIMVSDNEKNVLTPQVRRESMARFIFTNISSPAALVAIMAGTAVFLLDYTVEFWLVVKLSLVTCLVILHALTGLLILGFDSAPQKTVLLKSLMTGIAAVVLMTAIIAVVLAKPDMAGLVVFP